MTPPRQIAETHPTRPCPECGQPARILHPRIEHLRMIGWQLFAEAQIVSGADTRSTSSSYPMRTASRPGWCRSSGRGR